ncbi:MAG: type II toxin-antitoxin system HicA family toxin [Coriobacteriia bacterium]|nr:type II toxin-antitoxin system HicA family toxin [Coriobacteriia bacterium]
MKRRKLIKQIESMGFEFERHGGNHDIYMLREQSINIPRHRKLKEGTVRGILKMAERIIDEGSLSNNSGD